MPILSSRFFKDHKPSSAFYQKWREIYSWSSRCLPIYEWDGVLFVGCLQPPADFPKTVSNAQIVFVLCEPLSLKNCWREFEAVEINKTSSSITLPKNFAIPAQTSSATVESAVPEDPFESLGLQTSEIASPEETISTEETAEESTEESSEEAHPEPQAEAAPDGFFLDAKVEAPKFDADVIKTLTSIKVEKEPPKEVTAITKTTSNKAENIYTKPGALSSNRELAEKHELSRTSISTLHRTANKLSDVVKDVFSQMSKHYQKSMILLAEQTEARPWKWSESFHSQDEANVKTISFSNPNPFRIVSRTQKSYHGYVVPNEVNDQFFAEWNASKTPDLLTVSPILIDENLVGFLLGISESTSEKPVEKFTENKESLMLCEKLAGDVGAQIKQDPLLLKAA